MAPYKEDETQVRTAAEAENLYRGYAATWDRVFGYHNADLAEIVKIANLKPTDRNLDLGCGNGQFHVYLAQSHVRPALPHVGIDACKALVLRAREMATAGQLESVLQYAHQDFTNAASLKEYEGMFDTVTAIGCFQHVAARDRTATLHLWQRCLKPGGRLILEWQSSRMGAMEMTAPGVLDPEGRVPRWHLANREDYDEWQTHFTTFTTRAGLELQSVHPYYALPDQGYREMAPLVAVHAREEYEQDGLGCESEREYWEQGKMALAQRLSSPWGEKDRQFLRYKRLSMVGILVKNLSER